MYNEVPRKYVFQRCRPVRLSSCNRAATGWSGEQVLPFDVGTSGHLPIFAEENTVMIQRSQTVYLLLAAICGGLTFFLPYAQYFAEKTKLAEYGMFGLVNLVNGAMESTGPYMFPAWVFGVFSVLVPLIAAWMYRNRPVQGKVARLASLVNLGYVVYLFFAIDTLKLEHYGESARVLFHAGFFAPVAAIAFTFLAVRGIRKDEALVKSLDRLR